MATYVILSKISPDAFQEPKELKKLASDVSTEGVEKARIGRILAHSQTMPGHHLARASQPSAALTWWTSSSHPRLRPRHHRNATSNSMETIS